jgi:hypothetical protein
LDETRSSDLYRFAIRSIADGLDTPCFPNYRVHSPIHCRTRRHGLANDDDCIDRLHGVLGFKVDSFYWIVDQSNPINSVSKNGLEYFIKVLVSYKKQKCLVFRWEPQHPRRRVSTFLPWFVLPWVNYCPFLL